MYRILVGAILIEYVCFHTKNFSAEKSQQNNANHQDHLSNQDLLSHGPLELFVNKQISEAEKSKDSHTKPANREELTKGKVDDPIEVAAFGSNVVGQRSLSQDWCNGHDGEDQSQNKLEKLKQQYTVLYYKCSFTREL